MAGRLPGLERTAEPSRIRILTGLIFLFIPIVWITLKTKNGMNFNMLDYILILVFIVNAVIHFLGGAGYRLKKN